MEAARILCDVLRFCPRILAAVQRTERIDAAVSAPVWSGPEERAHVGQPAAGPAVGTAPPSAARNRQHGRQRPAKLRTPRIAQPVGHASPSAEYILDGLARSLQILADTLGGVASAGGCAQKSQDEQKNDLTYVYHRILHILRTGDVDPRSSRQDLLEPLHQSTDALGGRVFP